eukprot:12888669-Prorocentrum_lima.AAC.1
MCSICDHHHPHGSNQLLEEHSCVDILAMSQDPGGDLQCRFNGACACRRRKPMNRAVSARLMSSQAR